LSASSFTVAMPLVSQGEPETFPGRFSRIGINFINKQCNNDEELIAFGRQADAIITVASLRPMPRRVIEQLENCRLIANTQIGYDPIDVAAAIEKGILVTNVPDYCTEEVSDHVMALILACARKIVELDGMAKSGNWGLSVKGKEIQTKIWPRMSLLKGQTLGIVGLGRIGRSLLPKARGFQLRIIAYDPYVSSQAGKELGVEMVDWDTLLRESDFMTIHALLTAENRRMINAGALNKMKSTAVLVNASRGGFVDESALYQALKSGRIAMAALDVLDPEPPQTDSPLLTLDNVILTAHSAFFSPSAEIERWRRGFDEIVRVKNGGWPQIAPSSLRRNKNGN
jgi:D-3-phosphoglycerate dehydrogenase / 2-oxoglutarate reductase